MASVVDAQVTVRFVTADEYTEYRIDDDPIAIPRKLGRYGLSEVINHLLDKSVPQPFDFSLNDVLLREPLSDFIASQNLSVENILTIEYFPAYGLSDRSERTDINAWIGCMDALYDEQLLFAGCFDGSIQVLSNGNNVANYKMQAHEDPIRAVTTWKNSDGIIITATGSKDQSIKCWSAAVTDNNKSSKKSKKSTPIASAAMDMSLQFSMNEHGSSVESLTYHSDREMLFSGDWTGNLLLWNVSSSSFLDGEAKEEGVEMKSTTMTKAHTQAISGIDVSQGDKMYTASWDHCLKQWDIERQDCISVLTTESKIFTSLDFNFNTKIIATSHNDGKIRLWDTRKSTGTGTAMENTSLKISNSPVNAFVSQVKWHPTVTTHFVTCDYLGMVRIWDMRATSTPLDTVEAHDGKTLCLQWMPNNRSEVNTNASSALYTGGSDCIVRKYDFGF